MNEEFQRKVDELENKIQQEYEIKLKKKIGEERRHVLDSIMKIMPELEKNRDKIIEAIDNKDDQNAIPKDACMLDILDLIGKRGEENVYKDSRGRLLNDAAKLIGFCENDTIIFYDCEDIEQQLIEDDKKAKEFFL